MTFASPSVDASTDDEQNAARLATAGLDYAPQGEGWL